jgi:ankyrin repeat protein
MKGTMQSSLVFLGKKVHRVVLSDRGNETPGQELLAAVKRGEVDEVADLIGRGADVETRDGVPRTALFIACVRGWVQIVILLIKAKARLDAKCEVLCLTPLMAACRAGIDQSEQIVTLLIKAGADLNRVDLQGRTALMVASGAGQLKVAKRLCMAGAKVRLKDKSGKTAIQFANDEGMRKLLRGYW